MNNWSFFNKLFRNGQSNSNEVFNIDLNNENIYDLIFICPGLLEPGGERGGGIEKVDLNIAFQLSDYYQVCIIGPYYKEYKKKRKNKTNLFFEFIKFPALSYYPSKTKFNLYLNYLFYTPFYIPLLCRRMVSLINPQNQVFIVHNSFIGLIAVIVSKIFNKKVIFFEGNLRPWINPNLTNIKMNFGTKLFNVINIFTGFFICILSNKIIVQSSLINERLIKMKIQREKIKNIVIGVDNKKFQRTVQSKSNGIIKVGFIGRLVEEKGALLLLDIIKKSIFEIPSCSFIIMGEGDLRHNFSNLPNIEHVGWVSEPQIVEYLREIQVVLFFQKSIGLAEMEVMSLGKVIIACDCGDVSHIIKHMQNGILCKPKGDCYIHYLKKLSNDFALVEMLSNSACLDIEKNYTWTIIAKKWNECIHDCIRE